MNTYRTDLFRTNPTYECHSFGSREEWLAGRMALRGVGGSDASAAIGRNRYRSTAELWRIKTGRSEPEDISNLESVAYGRDAEESIRYVYQLDRKSKYLVNYKPDCILKSKEYPCMLYSPDGLLEEIGTGRIGVLEIKTSTIHGNGAEWKDRIPMNYYAQVLHGMAVTGAEFVELRALLIYTDEYSAVRTYHIERSECESDIEFVINRVKSFWRYVEADKEPPTIIGG